MNFLQRMEDSLAVDVAGSYSGLRQQLCTHKVTTNIDKAADKHTHRSIKTRGVHGGGGIFEKQVLKFLL